MRPGETERATVFWRTLADPESWGRRALTVVSRSYYLDIVERYEVRSVLDLGCASGITCDLFEDNVVDLQYCGIDVVPEFVNICKMKHPDVDFLLGQIQAIPVADRSFEMATCRAVLEHLPDPIPAIEEMARVASKIVVIVWFLTPSEDRFKYDARGFWNNIYDRERILSAMEGEGLRLVDEFKETRHLIWILEREN